jgi:hypothetical protein
MNNLQLFLQLFAELNQVGWLCCGVRVNSCRGPSFASDKHDFSRWLLALKEVSRLLAVAQRMIRLSATHAE